MKKVDDKYRILSENASDVLWTADMNLCYTYISPSVKYVFGYTADEMLHHHVGLTLTPSFLQEAVKLFQEEYAAEQAGLNKKENFRVMEASHIRKDGAIIWVEVKLTFIRDDNGSPCGVMGITRDITQRKEAERLLRESEERGERQRTAIAEIVTDNAVISGDISAALQRITEILADTIKVARGGVWALNEEGTELRCLSLFEASDRKHSHGQVINANDLAPYFAAIIKDNRIYTEDARNDPRTREMTETYLQPLGITSMLDAGIVIEGKLKGVVCLEHIGEKRKWHSDEEAFVSTAAAILAQIIINDERRRINESLQFQLGFEKMVAEISSYFIRLPGKDFDKGVNYALQKTGELFQVDRSYLFQFSADQESLHNTHEWCRDGIMPQQGVNQNLPVQKLSWWMKQISSGQNIYIPDTGKLPPEAAAEKEIFLLQDIWSLLCVPVSKNDRLLGFFGFDTVNRHKVWLEDQIVLLKVIAELITNALIRHQDEKKIRYLSYRDRLTGLYNRHYMEEAIARHGTPAHHPLSIIMADLNGLKLVNDTYGHEQGDQLLAIAAGILVKSCRREDIIARWGGDEFIILLPRAPVETALSVAGTITANCHDIYVEDVPLSIAVGVAEKNGAEKSFAETLRKAEDDMYRQKLTESRSTKNTVIKALLKTMADKSFETKGHIRRMQKIARTIGRKLNLPDSEISRLDLLVALHDIGNINITNDMLTREGPLTAEEWETIKKHPETGYRIARVTEDFNHVAKEILSHHEHWDGSGYPGKLQGREIPLLARIAAIADAYDVMSSGRPYKKAMHKAEIAAELKRCAGTQFDPDLVEIFLSFLDEIH